MILMLLLFVIIIVIATIEILYLVRVGQEDLLHETVRSGKIRICIAHFQIALRDTFL
jgi:hypothetical protein